MTYYICALPYKEHYSLPLSNLLLAHTQTHIVKCIAKEVFPCSDYHDDVMFGIMCVLFHLIHSRIKSFDYLNVPTHLIVLLSLFCIIVNLHLHRAHSREIRLTITMNS
jgi:hypothetical protein